jgi:LPS export ABC transporter permease LptG
VRLLGRYIFREILTSSLLGTGLATFVIFLQKVDKLFEVLLGAGNPSPKTVFTLLAYSLPPVLPQTIPFGVLVGILIGLGRMSSDGEIVAMRAAGVSSRKVILPVLLFAAMGAILAGEASLRMSPYCLREATNITYELARRQVSSEIKPRSFVEDFPNMILYVGDVRTGNPTVWRNVFLADVTPPEQRQQGMGAKADGPLVTVARSAVAVPDPDHNRVQLSMHDRATHEMGKDGKAHDSEMLVSEQALDAKPPEQKTLISREMNTRALLSYYGPDWIDVQVELNQRFALPLACIMLAMVGIPLGIATRKGGKGAGYVNAVFLAFFGYYLTSISLLNLAKKRSPFHLLGATLPPMPIPMAVWLPDVAFFLAGVVFLYRMESPGDRDLVGTVTGWFERLAGRFKRRAAKPAAARPRLSGIRLPLLPQIIDTYVLANFVFYLCVVLASFVSMILVYNFFELMGDMFQRNIPLMTMFKYLFFLAPEEIYEMLPLSVLVAVLINFGVLSKQNEVTAFRACGVSLHRLAAPILIGSILLSGGLFAFNYYYVPAANLRQQKLRDIIKGRTTQTYLCPGCKWIRGYEGRIYYYKYFDTQENVMDDVSVFELEPSTFRLTRQIQAKRASWSKPLKTWVFENGWSSDFKGTERLPWGRFEATTFRELTEPPDYFLTEAVQDKQMSFLQLGDYIRGLEQRGFDTVKLQVQYHLKFAAPLFALIMAMIAAPFGFRVGNRGRMTGIGVSLAIAIAYRGIGTLFEKIGDLNQLLPPIAAWSPDVVFGLAGLYMLLRMRS